MLDDTLLIFLCFHTFPLNTHNTYIYKCVFVLLATTSLYCNGKNITLNPYFFLIFILPLYNEFFSPPGIVGMGLLNAPPLVSPNGCKRNSCASGGS